MGSHVAASRVPATQAHASMPQPASLAEQAAPSEPASAQKLFLHLHNAELPLRWKRRSWDTRQGTQLLAPSCTAGSEPTQPGGKGEREASPDSGKAAASWHHGWRGEVRHRPQHGLLGLGVGAEQPGCSPAEVVTVPVG